MYLLQGNLAVSTLALFWRQALCSPGWSLQFFVEQGGLKFTEIHLSLPLDKQNAFNQQYYL